MPPVVTQGSCLGLFARAAEKVVRQLVAERTGDVRPPDAGRPRAAARASVVEPLERRELLSSYFVSPAGSDAAAGSLAAPFKTIQKAANVAQPGDVVNIRAGTYRETVTAPRSGTSSAPIVFQAYNGEKVTISGADVIKGWSAHAGTTYKASMPWDMGWGENQVFVNGQAMVEARWPNTTLDLSNPAKATADGGTSGGYRSGTIVDAAMPFGSTINGATLHAELGEEWLRNTGTVNSAGGGRFTFTLHKDIASTQGTAKAGNTYFLTGKFQFLDAENEWFRDGAGALYLKAAGGADPDNVTVEAKRRDYAFVADNKNYIHLKGIQIFGATIKTGYNSVGIVIDGLKAKYVSHFSIINASGGIWGIGNRETGIILRGHNNVVKNSLIEYSAGNGITVQGNNNLIQNNVIHGVNYTPMDNANVWTSGTGIKILQNTMYNSGRSIIKHNGSPGIQIKYNYMHHAVLQTQDGGATYTYGQDGRGATIAYNVVHDVLSGGQGGVGIYLDRYSKNYIVHHNVVYRANSSMKLVDYSYNNKVYNNTLDGEPKSIGNWRTLDHSGTVFKNNIFTGSTNIGGGAVQSNNLFSGTNPMFVNEAARNYQLQAGSPAINKGAFLTGITEPGITPDIGAYEYGRTPWRAGASLSASYVPPPTTSTGGGTTTPPPTTTTRSARSIMQAEAASAQFGTVNKGLSVGDTDNNDWLRFDDVDFGAGVSQFRLSLAAGSASSTRKVEVRVGSATGTLLGAYTLASTGTGGWSNWTERSTGLSSSVTGVHDLYVVFKNSAAGDVANVSWVSFA